MKQCFLYLSGMLAYVFIAMPKLNLSITSYLFKRPHETRVPVWEAEPTKHYSEKESNKIFYWLFKPLKWFSYEIKIWIMWADRFSLTSYQMLRLTLNTYTFFLLGLEAGRLHMILEKKMCFKWCRCEEIWNQLHFLITS